MSVCGQGSISFIRDEVIFKSQVIARLLEQCQQVVIFAVTIGNRLEEIRRNVGGDESARQAERTIIYQCMHPADNAQLL